MDKIIYYENNQRVEQQIVNNPIKTGNKLKVALAGGTTIFILLTRVVLWVVNGNIHFPGR